VLRWWAWSAVGWPFTTGAAVLVVLVGCAGGAALLLPSGALGWVPSAAMSAVKVWPSGLAGAWCLGAVVFAWILVRHFLAGTVGRAKRVALALVAGFLAASFVASAMAIGPVGVLVVLVGSTVAVAVDQITPFVWPRAGLVRRFAEFAREIPPTWTDVAARSARIQSIDVGIERAVAQGAKDRPILEHPALGGVWSVRFDFERFAAEVPIARPEGRTFEELADVLDAWAAQLFGVSNRAGSLALVDVESPSASSAVLRITFVRPSLRRRPAPRPEVVLERPAHVDADGVVIEMPDRSGWLDEGRA